MTLRLYYEDPYRTDFSAQVVESLLWEGHPAVILDRTAFYPTGGGQPHDVGVLSGVPVLDVVEREADAAVIHVLGAELEACEVDGRVDWARRFDLMQQHTGQHILSAAALARLGANTVGFHLADEYATVDLDQAPLSPEAAREVEDLANAIVFEDRQVTARFVSLDEVPVLTLRKPVKHAGPVRIVEVLGFDCSACGGTHVRATGQVGLAKITRTERRGSETRLEFLCGTRALRDYAAKHALLAGMAGEFTVSHWELPDAVHRLADELQEARRELRRSREALLDAEADGLLHQAGVLGATRVVQAHLLGRSPDDLKHLAQRLIAHPHTVALLASGRDAEKAHFLFARSAGVEANMGALVRQACEVVGGRGGGRPEFAQGGGPLGGRAAEALRAAAESLTAMLGANAGREASGDAS